MRKEYNNATNFRQFFLYLIIHIGPLPIVSMKNGIKMIFLPCCEFIHIILRNNLIYIPYRFNYSLTLLKGNYGCFVLISLHVFISANTYY